MGQNNDFTAAPPTATQVENSLGLCNTWNQTHYLVSPLLKVSSVILPLSHLPLNTSIDEIYARWFNNQAVSDGAERRSDLHRVIWSVFKDTLSGNCRSAVLSQTDQSETARAASSEPTSVLTRHLVVCWRITDSFNRKLIKVKSSHSPCLCCADVGFAIHGLPYYDEV